MTYYVTWCIVHFYILKWTCCVYSAFFFTWIPREHTSLNIVLRTESTSGKDAGFLISSLYYLRVNWLCCIRHATKYLVTMLFLYIHSYILVAVECDIQISNGWTKWFQCEYREQHSLWWKECCYRRMWSCPCRKEGCIGGEISLLMHSTKCCKIGSINKGPKK